MSPQAVKTMTLVILNYIKYEINTVLTSRARCGRVGNEWVHSMARHWPEVWAGIQNWRAVAFRTSDPAKTLDLPILTKILEIITKKNFIMAGFGLASKIGGPPSSLSRPFTCLPICY